MHRWLFLNALPWYTRWPVKNAVMLVTLFFVLFPDPRIFVRQVEHWRNPNALIDPSAVSLQPLIEELGPKIKATEEPREALRAVESFVLKKVKYEWDWNNWGAADYMPTVEEVLSKGSEDCDGRAVVAASLLKHFGYKPKIVTDFSHVWVSTEQGDTMGPGKTKAVRGEKGGIAISREAIGQVPSAVAFGLSVFPLGRELIIIVMAWWLLLRRGGGKWSSLASLFFLVNGLIFLRIGGQNYREPQLWLQWLGVANALFGMFTLLVVSSLNARRWRDATGATV